uniref:Uncharacterized protein n=1 Tax=Ditylenchus dipsaci TaxID=166011 RepID=A0A915E8M7_9BILA
MIFQFNIIIQLKFSSLKSCQYYHSTSSKLRLRLSSSLTAAQFNQLLYPVISDCQGQSISSYVSLTNSKRSGQSPAISPEKASSAPVNMPAPLQSIGQSSSPASCQQSKHSDGLSNWSPNCVTASPEVKRGNAQNLLLWKESSAASMLPRSDVPFQDGTPEQQAPRSDAGWVKCASSSGRLVSHMVSSSASSHVYAPTPVKWGESEVVSQPSPMGSFQQPAQPSVPVSCQSSGLQLIQSCYGDSSDDEEDLQSTEFNSLLTSVIPPVSIKSLSMCTDSAASITPRPKCSGIDSPPMRWITLMSGLLLI